jgi:hypothetical protein
MNLMYLGIFLIFVGVIVAVVTGVSYQRTRNRYTATRVAVYIDTDTDPDILSAWRKAERARRGLPPEPYNMSKLYGKYYKDGKVFLTATGEESVINLDTYRRVQKRISRGTTEPPEPPKVA